MAQARISDAALPPRGTGDPEARRLSRSRPSQPRARRCDAFASAVIDERGRTHPPSELVTLCIRHSTGTATVLEHSRDASS